MPTFYFHIRDHDGFIIDNEGQTFPDLASARIEAEQSARELIAADVVSGQLPPEDASIEIADQTGAVVASIPFKPFLSADRIVMGEVMDTDRVPRAR